MRLRWSTALAFLAPWQFIRHDVQTGAFGFEPKTVSDFTRRGIALGSRALPPKEQDER